MATPQIQRAVLVIADIGGYTRFMKLTRMHPRGDHPAAAGQPSSGALTMARLRNAH